MEDVTYSFHPDNDTEVNAIALITGITGQLDLKVAVRVLEAVLARRKAEFEEVPF